MASPAGATPSGAAAPAPASHPAEPDLAAAALLDGLRAALPPEDLQAVQQLQQST